MASENISSNNDGEHSTDINQSSTPETIHRKSISPSIDTDENKLQARPQSTKSVAKTALINPDYMTISGHLRSSICFGYPVSRGSHSKIVHNPQVFKEHFDMVNAERQRRQQQSFRRKKDWLGRWTEANITRERLLKEMLEAQKKASVPSS